MPALELPPHIAVVDLMGSPVKAFSRPGEMPVYVTGMHGLKPDFPAPEPVKVAHAAAPAVVLRVRPGAGFLVRNRTGLEGSAGEAVAEVFNFSGKAVSGSVRNLGSGYVVTGLERPLKLAPMSSAQIPLKFVLREGVKETAFRFDGVFSGKPIAPVMIPVRAPEPH